MLGGVVGIQFQKIELDREVRVLENYAPVMYQYEVEEKWPPFERECRSR